eukprot:9350654-Lingulodinium_polyedra.AAC.1
MEFPWLRRIRLASQRIPTPCRDLPVEPPSPVSSEEEGGVVGRPMAASPTRSVSSDSDDGNR